MKRILILLIAVSICPTLTFSQYNVLTDHAESVELTPNSFKANKANYPGNNVGIGAGTMKGIISGSKTPTNNVAFGYRSLHKFALGSYNTAIGGFTLSESTNSGTSTAIGFGSMINNDGSGNLAIGYLSGAFAPSSFGKLSIGYGAAAYDSSASVAIGALAGTTGTKENDFNIYIGASTGTTHQKGDDNVAIGAYTLDKGIQSEDNVLIGSQVLRYPSLFNRAIVAVGYQAMQQEEDKEQITSGAVALGYKALQKDSNSIAPVAIGYLALNNAEEIGNTVAVGHKAFRFLKNGNDNTGIGYEVGGFNSFNINGTTIEFGLTEAGLCTLVGYRSGQSMFNNVVHHTAIGARSLYDNQSNTSNNTGIGYNSGNNSTTGSNNTFIGAESKTSSGSLSNVTVIGYNAMATSSNMVILGDNNVNTIGGYASFTNFSDKRLKKNITYTSELGIDFIRQLHTAQYQYKSNPTSGIIDGLIAQDVQEALLSLKTDFSGLLILENKAKTMQLAYESFTLPLINSTQELNNRLEKLKKTEPLNLDAYFAKLK